MVWQDVLSFGYNRWDNSCLLGRERGGISGTLSRDASSLFLKAHLKPLKNHMTSGGCNTRMHVNSSRGETAYTDFVSGSCRQ